MKESSISIEKSNVLIEESNALIEESSVLVDECFSGDSDLVVAPWWTAPW